MSLQTCQALLRPTGVHSFDACGRRGRFAQQGRHRWSRQLSRPVQAMSSPGDQGKTSRSGLGVLNWAGSVVPQGVLVKGAKTGWRLAWLTLMQELAPQSKDGEFKRPAYTFNDRIGDAAFPVESGRYHLYVGNACPWCHRVLLALVVTGLGRHVSFSWAQDDPEKASRGGWYFEGGDPVFGCADLREVYDLLSPGYRGRCTAPLLVDKKARRIVCNESSTIVRSLGQLRMEGGTGVELYPEGLREQIDAWNDRIYASVNNGVYRSGFATSQSAYDAAQADLYSALDELETVLSKQRFVCGDRFTEADLRLFPTIARFDAVYATLFRCYRRRVVDYPSLSAWARDVQQITIPGAALQIKDCFDLDGARRSYFSSLFPLNPSGIVPTAPSAADLGWDAVEPGRGPRGSLGDVFHLRQEAPVAASAAASAAAAAAADKVAGGSS